MRISKSKPKFVMKSVKKSMALLLAMGSMAFCLPGLAQEHVYFSEDFPNGELGGNWNLEASTTIEAAGGPVYGVNMGDYIAMGWVWDLNGQMITNNNRPVATTQLNGRYLLTTVPFTMQTGDITNILSFGYEYMATAAVPASVRNFGVLVRQDGGEWDTVYRMFGETDSLATEFSGFQTVVLPEGYKGAEIELAFCFDAVHQGNSPYGFFIRFRMRDHLPAFVGSLEQGRFGHPVDGLCIFVERRGEQVRVGGQLRDRAFGLRTVCLVFGLGGSRVG